MFGLDHQMKSRCLRTVPDKDCTVLCTVLCDALSCFRSCLSHNHCWICLCCVACHNRHCEGCLAHDCAVHHLCHATPVLCITCVVHHLCRATPVLCITCAVHHLCWQCGSSCNDCRCSLSLCREYLLPLAYRLSICLRLRLHICTAGASSKPISRSWATLGFGGRSSGGFCVMIRIRHSRSCAVWEGSSILCRRIGPCEVDCTSSGCSHCCLYLCFLHQQY